MCKKIFYFFIFLITGFISLPRVTNAITITDTMSAGMDNTLYEDAFGSYSNGMGKYFFAGKIASGPIRRGLLSFRIEDRIPANAVITSVRLQLHMSRTISGPKRVELHRALRPWGEGNSIASGEEGIGAPPDTNDATWIHNYFDTQFWTNAGGDFNPVSSGNAIVDQVGFYEWSSPGMINDVTFWLSNTDNNNGWIITGAEDSSITAKRFDTKENPDVSFRPKLIVTYTTNSIGLRLTALTEGYWHGTDGGFVLPDTLRVYLRSASAPYTVVDSAVVFHGIVSNMVFSAPGGSYYIVVVHRNSIDTWSKMPVSFTTGFVTSYNFTSAAAQAFGNNLVLEAGFYSIYSGDVNKDGFINLTDIILDFNAGANFVTGYVQTDINGDNAVNLVDLLIIFNNSSKFVKVERPL